MSYTINTTDNGHIILYSIGSDFGMVSEVSPLIRETLALLDAGPERIVIVSDSRSLSIGNVNDVLALGSAVREDEAKRLLNHPKLLKLVTVTSNKVLQMALKGINTATFGFVDITVMTTMEEGLNAARNLIYGQSKAN